MLFLVTTSSLSAVTRHGCPVLLFLVTASRLRPICALPTTVGSCHTDTNRYSLSSLTCAVICSAPQELTEGSGSSANLCGLPSEILRRLSRQPKLQRARNGLRSFVSGTPPRVFSPGLLLESSAVWLKVVCPLTRIPVE